MGILCQQLYFVPKSPKGLKTRKSKFHQESEQDKISKSKLRMERREDKLNRAQKKLDGKKPPKPRGPMRRVLGAAGWNVHGFVHGKIYEVEHENVGTEGARQSEIVREAALRQGTRYVKKRIREHPARAIHKAEGQYIKARADYQFRAAAQENPELSRNAVTLSPRNPLNLRSPLNPRSPLSLRNPLSPPPGLTPPRSTTPGARLR